MRKSLAPLTLALLASSAFAMACSNSRDEPPTSRSSAAAQATPQVDARGVVVRGGEFRFVLDESPKVAARVRSDCAATPDPESCARAIRDQGASEGMRFIPIDGDHARLQSFGYEEDHEEIYIEARFAIDAVDGRLVRVHPTEPLKGTGLPRDPSALKELAIEVVDADTIAMTEEDKGRLVYRRRAPR